MVNNYIKEATSGNFSAKDFRTWAGSIQAIESFESLDPPQTATDVQKNILAVLDQVSAKLGNSRNICKKYYVHPELISLYEQNKLTEMLNTGKTVKNTSQSGLSPCEKLLMYVLKKSS
jgi:DNA topoisomerase-1